MAATESLHLPPTYPDDVAASVSMMESCFAAYASSNLEGLTEPQAHVLLSYRDFARAVVMQHGPTLRYSEARVPIEAVASFISRRRGMAEGVVAMLNRRFSSGASPDGLGRAVQNFEYFVRIDAYCQSILDNWSGPSREWRKR